MAENSPDHAETEHPATKAILQQLEQADSAYKSRDYRKAAAIYKDVSVTCAQLHARGDPTHGLSKPFLEMFCHYCDAAANKTQYQAVTAEGGPRSERQDHADATIRSATASIACLRTTRQFPEMLESAYEMLIDGFDYLMASRPNLDGITEAGKRMEAAIDEYRKLVSPTEFERIFKRLLYARMMTDMADGIKCLFHDRNHQASQRGFKRAREFASQAFKASTDERGKKDIEGYIALLGAMENLGGALTLQEKGDYLTAAAKMNEAEIGFGRVPEAVGFVRWAQAAQPYYRAMSDELEGDYDSASRGFERAAKAFALAADAFPASSPEFSSMGSWVQFYAEAAGERAKVALTRKGAREQHLEKAKRHAGLLFFGFWLVGIGAVVAAIRLLLLSVDVSAFLVLVLLSFLTAGVAATLIKPEAALDFLHSVFPRLKTKSGNTLERKE